MTHWPKAVPRTGPGVLLVTLGGFSTCCTVALVRVKVLLYLQQSQANSWHWFARAGAWIWPIYWHSGGANPAEIMALTTFTYLLGYLLTYLPYLTLPYLAYLLTYSLNYFLWFLSCLLTYSLTCSLTHSLACLLAYLLTYLLTRLLPWQRSLNVIFECMHRLLTPPTVCTERTVNLIPYQVRWIPMLWLWLCFFKFGTMT